MFIKVQNFLEAGFEHDLLVEEYSWYQLSFTTSTRANDRQKAKVGINFFVHAFGPGMIYPMQANNNASTPEW